MEDLGVELSSKYPSAFRDQTLDMAAPTFTQ